MKILQAKPDDEACQDCLNRLDEYIATQLAGEDYLARLPDVATHLDACIDCAEAYARLYELEVAEAADNLPQPQQLSEPDLGFLRRRMTDLTTRLRDALRRTAEQVTFQLSAELLLLLRPLPTASLTRSPSDSQRYSEVLLNLEPAIAPDLDLPINMAVYRDAQQPETCLVEVVIKPPDQSWPDLGGRLVILNAAGQTRETISDAWGIATFEGVRLDDLSKTTITVTLND